MHRDTIEMIDAARGAGWSTAQIDERIGQHIDEFNEWVDLLKFELTLGCIAAGAIEAA